MTAAITVQLPPDPEDFRTQEWADTLRGKPAPELPDVPVLNAPCAVRNAQGEPVAVLGRLPEPELTALRRALLAWPDSASYRALGFSTRSRTFGYTAPSSFLRRDGCRSCEGAQAAPEQHATICAMAHPLAELYRQLAPELADRDEAAAWAAVLPDWRLEGTQWNSGVTNTTSPLPYHRDGNNLRPVWSAMVVCRRGVRGGQLHVPELGVQLACRDGDVVFFPGWRYVHGVTPMRKVDPDGYRYTSVYYAVDAMRKCGPADGELARMRAKRTHREDKLLPPDHPEMVKLRRARK